MGSVIDFQGFCFQGAGGVGGGGGGAGSVGGT